MKIIFLSIFLIISANTFALDNNNYISSKIEELKTIFLNAGFYYTNANGNYLTGERIQTVQDLNKILGYKDIYGYPYQIPFTKADIEMTKNCINKRSCQTYIFSVSMSIIENGHSVIQQQEYITLIENGQQTHMFSSTLGRNYLQ